MITILASVALMCGGGFNEAEIECEEAVAHLASCCPSFDTRAVYCHVDTGCGVTTYPTITLADSRCIRAKTCDQINTDDLCARVASLPSRTTTSYEGDGGKAAPAAEEVCK